MPRGERWLPCETEFLREHAGTLTSREIGKRLNRSLDAVVTMASQLKIALSAAAQRRIRSGHRDAEIRHGEVMTPNEFADFIATARDQERVTYYVGELAYDCQRNIQEAQEIKTAAFQAMDSGLVVLTQRRTDVAARGSGAGACNAYEYFADRQRPPLREDQICWRRTEAQKLAKLAKRGAA